MGQARHVPSRAPGAAIERGVVGTDAIMPGGDQGVAGYLLFSEIDAERPFLFSLFFLESSFS
jgi:hypothetical protein